MRFVVKIVRWLLGLIVMAVAGLFAWLYIAPPELIRVGSGYSAKIVCSNVFIAGRDANEVLAVDVQAPGHPLLRLMRVSVDKNRGTVSAGLLGFLGKSEAVSRDGLGCASIPDGDVGKARRTTVHETVNCSSPANLIYAAVGKGLARSTRARSSGEFITAQRSLRRWTFSQKSGLLPNTRARMSAVAAVTLRRSLHNSFTCFQYGDNVPPLGSHNNVRSG